jgi:Protein of unknown function (DUF3105)
MTNRQTQRDAERDRRRQERQRARREIRQTRAPEPPPTAKGPPEPEKRSLPWAWIAVGIVAAILLAAGGVFLFKSATAPLPGQTFASLGNMHINPGDAHPQYNSNPPTSGWHYPTWPQRGIYTAALPEEYLLHFQEHAGVVVHYNPDKLPPDELTKLRTLVNGELSRGQGLVLLSPDTGIPETVALTSWQHLETFDSVSGNEQKIRDFIERLECNYDPEGVCGPPHGNSFQPTGTPAPGVATVIGAPIGTNVPQGTVAPGQKAETPVAGTPAR